MFSLGLIRWNYVSAGKMENRPQKGLANNEGRQLGHKSCFDLTQGFFTPHWIVLTMHSSAVAVDIFFSNGLTIHSFFLKLIYKLR